MKNCLLLCCICLLIISCGRMKYIPVENSVITKDSVITRDSVILKEKLSIKDSISLKDSTVIVVDDKGNVLRTELYRYRDSYKEVTRDYLRLRMKYDSLLKLKQTEIQVPYPVEVVKNRIPGIMWWIILVLAVCSAPSIFKIIRKFV